MNVSDVYAPAIAKSLQENLSTSDELPVSNKQISKAYGGIGFCKEEARTFAQLLLHWDHGMNYGRQIFCDVTNSTRLRRSRQQVSNPVSLLSMVELSSQTVSNMFDNRSKEQNVFQIFVKWLLTFKFY